MPAAWTHAFIRTAAACGVLLLAHAPGHGAEALRPIAFMSASTIKLAGDSTLHAFESTARAWTIEAAVSSAPEVGTRVGAIDVRIRVRDLKSGDGALDANMYKALGADAHPTIRFQATRCEARVTGPGTVRAEATGVLAVAGVERPTTIQAEGRLEGDRWRLRGTKELSMKAFGIEPPVLLGGMIRCADRIVIAFDLEGREGLAARP